MDNDQIEQNKPEEEKREIVPTMSPTKAAILGLHCCFCLISIWWWNINT